MATLTKSANNGSTQELIDWARGIHTPAGKSTDASVAAEAVKRFGLENTTDVNAVKEQILAEQAPQEAPEPQTAAPAVSEEEAVIVVEEKDGSNPAPVPQLAPVNQLLNKNVPANKPAVSVVAVSNVNEKIIVESLEKYAKVMQPGTPHPNGEGEIAQVSFFRTIEQILRLDAGEFTKHFGNLLNFVRTHRKAMFNERYAYRYFDTMRLGTVERKNFERMMNLLIATCEPGTRHTTIKQIDLVTTVSGFSDTRIQQRVMDFYTI